MRKVLLCFVLIMAMLMPNIGFAGAAGYTDTVGTKYEAAANMLSQFKIIEGYSDGSFNVNGTITRAEFATILSKLTPISNLVGDKVYFYDVPENYWARKAINNVVAGGLMDSDGQYFRPDESLTEAVLSKSLVVLLGYGEYAQSTTYSAVAASLGIYKNIKFGSKITRGDVLLVIYNALSVDMADVRTIRNDGSVQIEKRSNYTLLTKNFNIYKTRGQITPAGSIDLVRNLNSRSNHVRIDDVLYELDEELDFDAGLIGRTGTFYYYSDDDVSIPKLKYFTLNNNDEVVEVSAKNIDAHLSTSVLLSYNNENGRKAEKQISVGAKFIVNGHLIADEDKNDSLFDFESGLVRVTSPSTGGNEVVWIESYNYYLVEAVGNDKLYLENGEQIDLDEERDDMQAYFYTATGDVSTFSNIVSKSAVAIADVKAADGILYRSVYILKSITAEVSEVSQDYITIGSEKYGLLKSFDSSKISFDKQYIFYLALDGEIALFREAANNQELFGYLIAAAIFKKGLSNDLHFKILIANGDKKVFVAKDVLYVNDIRVNKSHFSNKNDNPIYTYLIDGATNQTKRQVVIYKENEKGQITHIYTPMPKEVEDAVLTMDYPLARKQCKSSSIFNFGGELTLKSTGVIFAVPTNQDEASEEDFGVWPIANFANDQSYDVEGYNMNELCEADVIKVVTDTDVPFYNDSNTYTCIFDKKVRVLDDEGRETYAITYWQQGSKYTKTLEIRYQKKSYIDTLEALNEISRGDCFKIELTDDASQIKNIFIEFNESNRNFTNAGYNNGRLIFYGRVEAVGTNSVVIRQFTDDAQNEYVLQTYYLFKNAGRVSTYLYTGDDREIEFVPNCLAEVRVGDWVLMQARYAAPRTLVIYRDDKKIAKWTTYKLANKNLLINVH